MAEESPHQDIVGQQILCTDLGGTRILAHGIVVDVEPTSEGYTLTVQQYPTEWSEE